MKRTGCSIALMVMVFATASCATGSNSRSNVLAPSGVADPIQIGTESIDPIAFHRLVVRIESGTTVGHHYAGLLRIQRSAHNWQSNVSVASEDFRIRASEILRQHGYPVLGGDDIVFGRDDSGRARFRLGGTVDELAYDTYGPLAGGNVEAVLGIDWELLDTRVDSIVYQRHTRGQATVDAGQGSAIEQAFGDGLNRLLSDSAFVETLEARSVGGGPDVRMASEIELQACSEDGPLSLPDQTEAAFRAVVVLRPGGSIGSGVIISPDGHILTAAHVVSGVQRVPVRLRSGLEVDAEVVASDPVQDVALVRIPGSNHQCLPLSEARGNVGTTVFAVGSPNREEFSYSVARGVVSGYRELDGRRYIQTDASLNPGNSGGPLLTSEGEILGIVSWKIVEPETEGLGFGVPVEVVSEALTLRFE